MTQNETVQTVGDRAKLLSAALGISCSRIASMLLMHVSYFSKVTGKKVPAPTRNIMKNLFPELSTRWLFDGEGECDLTKVTVPKYLGQLTQYKPEMFTKIMLSGNTDIIVQYLQDNEVPVSEFVSLYGNVYRSLFPLIEQTPKQDPEQDNKYNVTAPAYTREEETPGAIDKLLTSISTLTATIAQQSDTIANQQNTINSLLAKIHEIEATTSQNK